MKIWFLILTLIFISNCLYAQEAIDIAGAQIPIMEGAVSAQAEAVPLADTRIAAFTTEKSLDSVVIFYESFFKDNGYLVIGGKSGGEYNASLKKENTMFTLRIYSESGRTIIQFIW